jgi:GPH family glycoside/pentoside/hexuronide:cation symporter
VINTLHDFVAAGLNWEQFMTVFRHAFISVDGTVTNEINGIRWISAVVGGLAIATAMITVLFCKERFSNVNTKAKNHVAMISAIKTTIKNKPFVNLMLIKIFQTLGDRVAGGILVFLGVYYVCLGDKSLAFKITGIGSTIGTVLVFAMLPVIKPISRWMGKKGGLILATGGSVGAAITIPFVYSPNHPYWMLLPALLTIVLIGIGSTISQAIMPDICDVDEVQTGHRREGLFTAVMGFLQKIEISLCSLAVGYLVVWSGLDTTKAVQAPEVLTRLYWLAVIPYVVFSVAAFLIAIRFPLTEAAMNDVRRQLDDRHDNLPETAPGIPGHHPANT